jgi:hypothetical protein
MKNKTNWLLTFAIGFFILHFVSVLIGDPQNHLLVISSVWAAATILSESEEKDE